MKEERKELSILVINERGQLSVTDLQEKRIKEYVFNKIGDCSNGFGICLGYDPHFKNDELGW